MCFLARLVLPSERIVSAEKLGGARGPGLRGQAESGVGRAERAGNLGRVRPFPGSTVFWQSWLLAGTFAPENPREVSRLKPVSLR